MLGFELSLTAELMLLTTVLSGENAEFKHGTDHPSLGEDFFSIESLHHNLLAVAAGRAHSPSLVLVSRRVLPPGLCGAMWLETSEAVKVESRLLDTIQAAPLSWG